MARDLEASAQAAESARAKTLASLKKHKVTEGLIGKRLYELLNAKETKVFNHQGKILYSTPLVAHGPRAKGIEIGVAILGMKAPEKLDIEAPGIEAVLLAIKEKRGKK